jgi:hypothetical protein
MHRQFFATDFLHSSTCDASFFLLQEPKTAQSGSALVNKGEIHYSVTSTLNLSNHWMRLVDSAVVHYKIAASKALVRVHDIKKLIHENDNHFVTNRQSFFS